MNKILGFFKKYRLGILSGLIVGTCYIPFHPWGIFFSYIPLWYWVFFKAQNGRDAFIAGWTTQFVLTLIGFHWIAYTAKAFGGFPWPLALIVLFLFCLLAHLYIPISMYLIFQIRKKFDWGIGHGIFSCVALVFLLEWFWPGIFPWHLGYTVFWSKLPIYQFADVIGFAGLSFLIFAGQGLIFYFLFRSGEGSFTPKRGLFHLGIALAIFALLNIAGYFHGLKWRSTNAELKILQVQANIGNLERMYAEVGKGFRDEIVKQYIDLSHSGLSDNADVDMVIWPEVAIPEYLDANYLNKPNQAHIVDFLNRSQKTLLAGAFSKDESIADADRSVFNALFLLDPNKREMPRTYRKTHLLAFGEYLPGSQMFPFLTKLLPFVSNFGRGPGPSILIFPKDQAKGDFVHLGAQICYEGLFPEFTVGLAQKGAEILVNVTNDSWFGSTFEPHQHLYMTLARAIEVRRPLIRSTNTGITTFVTAYGDVAEKSPINTVWVKRQIVPYRDNPEPTLFVQFGHHLWIVIMIAFFAHLLINGVYDKFRKSRLGFTAQKN
ncbi:MAG: apolipoprotein N-acyltransferase [Bdellovibrionaceae bacterium]|nr:apolipoprotein N-acyltransferase [Pseudobdellovibrionaceae bacterium]